MELSHVRNMTAEMKAYVTEAEAVMLRTCRIPFSSRVRNSIFLYPRAKVRSLICSEKVNITIVITLQLTVASRPHVFAFAVWPGW